MDRVLHVVTHMNRGGLETMLMNYYRHMDLSSIQFDFLTHREYDGDYGEEIHRMGGIIYHLPTLNPMSLHYHKALNTFFEQHPEYRIIHVHQDCLSGVILKVAKKHGVKVRIAHSHCSSQDKDIKYPIKMFFRPMITRYATALMACGKEAGEWMFGGAEFDILSNAINATLYKYDPQKKDSERQKWGVQPHELLVGHVGRFSPQKNHVFLIDIFNEIQRRVPAKLILVGKNEGVLAEQIEEKVAELGLQDKVIFTGLRSDVADLLQAMDVFVFPSLYEGLPVTMVEAQASGLPCLISDKVPIECRMTELVQQISLTTSPEVWAKKAIDAAKLSRKDTYEEIISAGFDIVENAKRLQEKYEEMMKHS